MRSNHHLFETITKENVFGIPMTREQVLTDLQAQPEIYREFSKLTDDLKQEFLEFRMGIR